MSLFTGRGDDGLTYVSDVNQRFSKDSNLTEALGTLDETNSLVGFLKVSIQDEFQNHLKSNDIFPNERLIDVLHQIQENLFIIQAELAGARHTVKMEKVDEMSDLINEIEKTIPPVSSFVIAGGSILAVKFDFVRTVARRAERRVISAVNGDSVKIGAGSLAYLNRLSSMLYALARLYNHKFGINEESPGYD